MRSQVKWMAVLVVGLVLAGCGGRVQLRAEGADTVKAGSRVLLLEPALQVYEIGLSQVPTRRADLESEARRSVAVSATKVTAAAGARVSSVPELTEPERYELEQRTALFYASVLAFSDMKKLGGSGWSATERRFEGSIGKSDLLAGIAQRNGLRYALLVAGTDVFVTPGAKAAALFSLVIGLGHSNMIMAGNAFMMVGLADLVTGRILWYAYDTTKGDLTDPETQERMLKSVLDGSPLVGK